MAKLAGISREDVCRPLAGRIGAVVAADTIASDICVVEVCRNPGGRRVAVIAIVATGYVGRVFARRDYAVVAGRTRTDDLCMVDQIGRRP